jgi:uncharacterized membrane protein
MNFLSNQNTRWIFALPFVVFGVAHVVNASVFGGGTDNIALEDSRLWIYIMGACLMASGIAIGIKKFDRMAALGLSLMLLIFIAVVQAPGLSNVNEVTKTLSFVGMLKDMSLAGGALTYAGLATGKM